MTNLGQQNKDDLADLLLDEFQIDTMVDRILAWKVPLSRSTSTTIFFNNKNQLFAYIASPARQTLGDVQKLLYRMGLVAYKFLPPANRPDYFTDIATEHFHKTFPNRKVQSENDLRYFKTLALYNPALVQIKLVKDGVIKYFDPDSKDQWRILTKLTYNRLDNF